MFSKPIVFSDVELSVQRLDELDSIAGETKVGNRRHRVNDRGGWYHDCQIHFEFQAPISGVDESARQQLLDELIDLGEEIEQAVLDASATGMTFDDAIMIPDQNELITPSFIYSEAEEVNIFHWIMESFFTYERDVGS